MNIHRLKIQGFKSFAEPTTFEFPSGNGLYMIRGKNEVEPSLGANGTGKSTIGDAICWCLYGKTARRLTAGTVESWTGVRRCIVELTVLIDGAKKTICRSRRPIRLTLNGEIVDQEVIDDLIGLSYDRFLQIVLLGQFGTWFSDMRPADRLTMLTEILDLGSWERCSELATKELRALGREETEYDKVMHGCHEVLATLADGRKESVARQARWEADRARRVKEMEGEVAEHSECLVDVQGALTTVQKLLVDASHAVEECENGLYALGVEKEEQRVRLATVQSRIDTFTRAAKSRRAKMEKLASLGGVQCPECLQFVPVVAENKAIAVLDAEARRSLDEVAKLKDAEVEAQGSIDELQRKIDAAGRTFVTLRQEKDQRRSDVRRMEGQISLLTQEIRSTETTIKTHRSMVNPHSAEIASFDKKIASKQAQLEEAEVLYYDVVTNIDLLSFWPRGFKEIRLWLIDQALDELTIHTNSSLHELGMKGWKIGFAVERETKVGTVSRGFEIMVYSPASPEGVPWESWSGGETQRLRVACAIGLANMIRSRMPHAPTLELWDEPTAHLDGEGVHELIEFFSERAAVRQVWLIDHRSLDSGCFSGMVLVTKDEMGSHISNDVSTTRSAKDHGPSISS